MTMIQVLVTSIMIPRLILWHKEASEKVYSSKFEFYIVKNIWFDTKIIQIGQVFTILLNSAYSKAAILKNDRHLKFIDG